VRGIDGQSAFSEYADAQRAPPCRRCFRFCRRHALAGLTKKSPAVPTTINPISLQKAILNGGAWLFPLSPFTAEPRTALIVDYTIALRDYASDVAAPAPKLTHRAMPSPAHDGYQPDGEISKAAPPSARLRHPRLFTGSSIPMLTVARRHQAATRAARGTPRRARYAAVRQNSTTYARVQRRTQYASHRHAVTGTQPVQVPGGRAQEDGKNHFRHAAKRRRRPARPPHRRRLVGLQAEE